MKRTSRKSDDADNPAATSVRLDKWMWAARFFKTRGLAARACELGRVSTRNQTAKAARDVRVGDLLQIRTEGGDFEVEILGLSDVRGPAPVAQSLYRETEASRELREKLAEARRSAPASDFFTDAGRPSKRDRRQIARLRGRS